MGCAVSTTAASTACESACCAVFASFFLSFDFDFLLDDLVVSCSCAAGAGAGVMAGKVGVGAEVCAGIVKVTVCPGRTNMTGTELAGVTALLFVFPTFASCCCCCFETVDNCDATTCCVLGWGCVCDDCEDGWFLAGLPLSFFFELRPFYNESTYRDIQI